MVKKSTTHKKPWSWLKLTIVTGISASIMLVVANSAFWVNKYIFNSDNFADVVSTSLTSESSRDAIASQITESALQNYPVAKNVAGESVTKVISGILGSDRVEAVINKVAYKLNIVFTSNNQESVVIDLSGVKDFLGKVVEVAGEFRDVKFDPNEIPEEIVLLDADKIPNFYSYSVAFLWLGPLALLGALGLFSIPYFKFRDTKSKTALLQGFAITVVSAFTLLIGPLFKPPILSNLENANSRIVVGNLYNDLYQTFLNQTAIIIGLGIVMALSGGGFILYKKYKK